MRHHLCDETDVKRIAQWLMDEGSVSLAHFARGNCTELIVCGSMNNYSVLSLISTLLEAPIASSRASSATTLPMGAVKVTGARAYALLKILKAHLVGLKRGRLWSFSHPQEDSEEDTLLTNSYAPCGKTWRKSLLEWNSRRKVKMPQQEIDERAGAWLEGRIRRARRFLDRQEFSHEVRPLGKQF